MAMRESFSTQRLSRWADYDYMTGALLQEGVNRVDILSCKYADTDAGKRKKPSVPELYPTSMQKFEWITFHGKANTKDRNPHNNWSVVTDSNFTLSSTSWLSLPGVSTYGNGWPTYTRSLEGEWACAAKLRSKILNSSLAMSVTLAEAKTTVSWMAQRTTDIAQMLRAIKQAKWGKLRQTFSNVSAEYKKLERGRNPLEVRIHSNGRLYFTPKYRPTGLPESPPKGWSTKPVAARWLEVRYAIGPLMADVDGIAKTLAEFLYENRLELLHRWATEVDIPQDRAAIKLEAKTNGFIPTKASVEVKWKSARVIKYSVYYTYAKWMAAFSKTQLGNMALVAWERTPYSFVFDWAVNVGQYLELADATVGCEFLSGTLSYRVAGEPLPAPVVHEPAWLMVGEVDVVDPPWTRYRIYERRVIGSFPNFLPTVRSPLSTTHVLDALALLRVLKP